jgi:hypothetical protein
MSKYLLSREKATAKKNSVGDVRNIAICPKTYKIIFCNEFCFEIIMLHHFVRSILLLLVFWKLLRSDNKDITYHWNISYNAATFYHGILFFGKVHFIEDSLISISNSGSDRTTNVMSSEYWNGMARLTVPRNLSPMY